MHFVQDVDEIGSINPSATCFVLVRKIISDIMRI